MYMKHNLRHLNYISSHLDSGNVCPACPQVGIYHCSCLFLTFLAYIKWRESSLCYGCSLWFAT
ncbi:hypothetical protein GBAR_LOCUS12112, partial [Geodia barretti]